MGTRKRLKLFVVGVLLGVSLFLARRRRGGAGPQPSADDGPVATLAAEDHVRLPGRGLHVTRGGGDVARAPRTLAREDR